MMKGRAWVFGDDIDTDVMMPGKALRMGPAEAARLLFEAVHPGFADAVRPGDIVVGGLRFGVGSARPVASCLRLLGVQAVVAESLSSLFQRNCINAGLFAVEVPGIRTRCRAGDEIEIDLDRHCVSVSGAGSTSPLTYAPLPGLVLDIIRAGGVVQQLVAGGYLPGP